MTPLCSRVSHFVPSRRFGAFHHWCSSSSSSCLTSFFVPLAGGAGLPFSFLTVALDFLEIGASESDSSFLTPFDLRFAPPVEGRLAFAIGWSSSDDSSFTAFLALALASLALMALASFSAAFSIEAFSFASLTPSGVSLSEDSRMSVSL